MRRKSVFFEIKKKQIEPRGNGPHPSIARMGTADLCVTVRLSHPTVVVLVMKVIMGNPRPSNIGTPQMSPAIDRPLLGLGHIDDSVASSLRCWLGRVTRDVSWDGTSFGYAVR